MTDNKGFIKRTMAGVRIYFVVITVFTAISFFTGNYYLGAVELAILAALGIHYLYIKKEKQRLITSYIEDLTFHLDNATKDTMLHFPLPMVMISLLGNVIWYNRRFYKIVGEEILEKQIQTVFPNLQLLKILEQKNNISFDLEHSGRYYQVVGNIVSYNEKDDKNNYSIVLYWIDRTEEYKTKQAYANDKMVSCELMVDNLEDLMKNTPDEAHASLTAEIEKKITEWLGLMGGIARKYEKDKYHIVFENKSLENNRESKFEIIDSAHEIQVGNKIPVTLSMYWERRKTYAKAIFCKGCN